MNLDEQFEETYNLEDVFQEIYFYIFQTMTNWKFDILVTLLYIQLYQFLIYLYIVQLYWHVSTVLNLLNM